MKIIPLSKVYMDKEIKESVKEVLESGWFIFGEKLKEFENKFAEFIGTKYAIGVSSGTAAIMLSLEALDVKKEDEILVPSHTAFPTVEAILRAGCTPKFVDIDPEIYNICPQDIKKKITKKTKGIVAVHLYGHPVDMDSIKKIAKDYNLFIIEDCAQAHGAEYKNQKVGSLGTVGCFSFYPSKNMTVCGDGGMVTTDDREIAERVRLLCNHGMKNRYLHLEIGYNFRLGEIQSAIGIKQLEKLKWFNERRRKLAHLYTTCLSPLKSIFLPKEKEWAYHVYHLYVIRTKNREEIIKKLKKFNINCEIHYPIPVHLQPAILPSSKTHLPVTEEIAKEILSLPMYPLLKEEEVKVICEKIKKIVG